MREVAEVELPTQENVRTDLRSVFQGAIRVVLEVILEEELREMVGAGRWERYGQRVGRSPQRLLSVPRMSKRPEITAVLRAVAPPQPLTIRAAEAGS